MQNALFHKETELKLIALTDFPCGHCRQFLSELHNSDDLQFVFLNGSIKEAMLPEILPFRFRPQDVLGEDTGDLLMKYNREQQVEFTKSAKEKIEKNSGDPLFAKVAEEARIHASKASP